MYSVCKKCATKEQVESASGDFSAESRKMLINYARDVTFAHFLANQRPRERGTPGIAAKFSTRVLAINFRRSPLSVYRAKSAINCKISAILSDIPSFFTPDPAAIIYSITFFVID